MVRLLLKKLKLTKLLKVSQKLTKLSEAKLKQHNLQDTQHYCHLSYTLVCHMWHDIIMSHVV